MYSNDPVKIEVGPPSSQRCSLMSGSTVLILADRHDEHAAHVQAVLTARGRDVVRLTSAGFPGWLQLALDPATGHGHLVADEGRRVDFEELQSVYWRNYSGVGLAEGLPEDQQWIAQNDARALFEAFLMLTPARWVNGWSGFTLHQTKPVPFARVARLGIPVPRTVLTNDPQVVLDFVAANPRSIVKPVQGGDHAIPIAPEHLTPKRLETLRFAPITVQEQIDGTNIRAFVAGDRVLGCEIEARTLDYRDDEAARVVPHALPEEIVQQSLEIARTLDLVWTGIDYRLDRDGRYVFLEANPSPMFLGFEEQSGVPLTEALVALL